MRRINISASDPEKFEDEYENALKELLRKKQKGERIERPKEPARTKVVNLMDALRQSVKEGGGSTARRNISRSPERRATNKTSRSAGKRRQAG
jgi:DNA end-binding protein Ku